MLLTEFHASLQIYQYFFSDPSPTLSKAQETPTFIDDPENSTPIEASGDVTTAPIPEITSTVSVLEPSNGPVDVEAEQLMTLPTTLTTETSTQPPQDDVDGSGDYEYLEGEGEHLQYTLTDADSFCPPGYWLKDGLCVGKAFLIS